jgi:NhaC family Na+:H+ antiporter
MGKMLGLSEGMVGGAIISGAYFGDKMSPLSDTTNLAPAMAGTDLFTHIRYMALTTVPSILITLVIFIVIGLNLDVAKQSLDTTETLVAIKSHFTINGWLFLAPALVIFLILKKVDALIAILAGAVMGGVLAIIFQPDIVHSLAVNGKTAFVMAYEGVVRSMIGEVQLQASDPMLTDLLTTGGMAGMLPTVWLIIAAMIFGGAMEAAGFLSTLTSAIANLARSTVSLISSTLGTCILLNLTASDQYLAIVVPGRMFKDLYKERGLAPENLSRSLEDSGTVTSVLIPWNTCGAYHSGVLGVATFAYLPFAFFNLLSPLMSLAFAVFKIKIRRL